MKQLILLLLALPFYSIAQPPAYVPSDSLVGWWGFNGNANDDSGNGINGTVTSATLTLDRFGNVNAAYHFDGIDDQISLGNDPKVQIENGTIQAWIKRENTDTVGFMDIINKRGNYSIKIQDGQFVTRQYNGGSGIQLSSGTYILDTNWHHLVIVFQSGVTNGTSFYFDGSKINSTTWSTRDHLYNLTFGNHPPFNTWFNGKIDDCGLWNRALDSCEINDLYTSTLNSCNPTSIISTEKNSISIYPNPSSGITHISSDVSIGQIIIYDMLGKEIIRQSCNSNQVLLNINEFASKGTYLFKIEDLSGKIIHTQKLIYR